VVCRDAAWDPRYLQHEAGVITAIDDHWVDVQLVRAVGRFRSGHGQMPAPDADQDRRDKLDELAADLSYSVRLRPKAARALLNSTSSSDWTLRPDRAPPQGWCTDRLRPSRRAGLSRQVFTLSRRD
jgi:hypothetical protein